MEILLNDLKEVLAKIQGAGVQLSQDCNSTNEVTFARIECAIWNLDLFEKSAPEFLLFMIEHPRMKAGIRSYNSDGISFYIARSIEVEAGVVIEPQMF